MDKKPLIMINTDNAPMFCRSRCGNTECSKHITKMYEYKGPCKMSLLKGQTECEGYISKKAKKENRGTGGK